MTSMGDDLDSEYKYCTLREMTWTLDTSTELLRKYLGLWVLVLTSRKMTGTLQSIIDFYGR